jgi:4-hydroxy-2-oxoheptanedioate aldolase
MRTNSVKARLKAGQPVFGCFITVPAPMMVELCGLVGFDFVVLDAEHAIADLETIENMIRAADATGIVPIVRIAVNQPQIILRYMDAGALGAQLPQINTAAETRQVVDAVKYRPLGKRGLAGVRATDYGMGLPYPQYIQQANEETLVVVHIETPEAVAQLEEMVHVPGVDVFFIGPTDLSYSLGFPGEPDHPEVQEVIRRIIAIVRGAGKVVGTMATDVAGAKRCLDMGILYLATGDRSLVVSSAQAYLQGVRGGSG